MYQDTAERMENASRRVRQSYFLIQRILNQSPSTTLHGESPIKALLTFHRYDHLMEFSRIPQVKERRQLFRRYGIRKKDQLVWLSYADKCRFLRTDREKIS